MTELVILAILLNEKYTIYKIKQKIKDNFSVFLGASFGSVYPAVKKLEKNGYIIVKQKMTRGGQKCHIYSITKKGKDYFNELMIKEIPDIALYSSQLINLKMMLLDFIAEDNCKQTINSIKKYYEINLLQFEELLGILKSRQTEDKEKFNYRIAFTKHYKDKILKELNWLQDLN